MDTYFAKAERVDAKTLASEVELVNNSPVLTGLLHSVNGFLAILDEHRQIVAVNDSLLKLLGIKDPAESLGLRPGEALDCIYSHDEPAGCGTTKLCTTCGAAIAIVSSLSENRPVERICALTANRGGQEVDIALLVKSHPTSIDGKRFLLLFLQDITLQQQRAALERSFFHDMNNIMTVLVGASDVLAHGDDRSNIANMIHKSSLRLKSEMEIQRNLLQSESYTYHPIWHKIKANQVLEDLQLFFGSHPEAKNKKLHFRTPSHDLTIKTDTSLLSRILCNMITNALEATAENGDVKVWVDGSGGSVSFSVWNKEHIPEEISQRIFQRNFSTKEGAGRGVGTYSMKLFGEKILGGQINFSSSKKEGTVFEFSLSN